MKAAAPRRLSEVGLRGAAVVLVPTGGNDLVLDGHLGGVGLGSQVILLFSKVDCLRPPSSVSSLVGAPSGPVEPLLPDSDGVPVSSRLTFQASRSCPR